MLIHRCLMLYWCIKQLTVINKLFLHQLLLIWSEIFHSANTCILTVMHYKFISKYLNHLEQRMSVLTHLSNNQIIYFWCLLRDFLLDKVLSYKSFDPIFILRLIFEIVYCISLNSLYIRKSVQFTVSVYCSLKLALISFCSSQSALILQNLSFD
jgi:hypothetical protein